MTKICEECVLRNTGFCAALIGTPPDKTVFENRKQGIVPARRFVQKDGDTKGTVKIIRRGWAASVERSDHGKMMTSEVLVAGDLIGGGFMSPDGRTRTVRAMTEVEFCSFDSEFLVGLVQSRRDLFELSIKISSDIVRALRERILDLGTRTAEQRVASLVVNIHDKMEERGLLKGPKMPFPLRQQDLADALGLTTVHTNRVLKGMREAGVLTIDSKEIYISDVEKIRPMLA